jgi:hypothetical protein
MQRRQQQRHRDDKYDLPRLDADVEHQQRERHFILQEKGSDTFLFKMYPALLYSESGLP